MKRFVGWSMVLAFAACTQADFTSSEEAEIGEQRRYLIVFRSEAIPADVAARVARAGGSIARSIPQVGIALAVGNATFQDRLANDPTVLAVGPEHFFRGTPTSGRMQGDAAVYGDQATFIQWDIERVHAAPTWLRNVPAAKVAVIDSGVAHDHPDLAGQVDYSLSTNACQGGGLGYPDYPLWIDFVGGGFCVPADTMYWDFHGTHVAGTIAAKRHNAADWSDAEWGPSFDGVVGVAPTAKLASYKVMDRFRDRDEHGNVIEGIGGFDIAILSAIVDATLRDYKVINMSLGGMLDRANRGENVAYIAWDRVAKWANRNGTMIVAAAGNSTTDNNGAIAFIPSDFPTVFSVSATGTSQLVFDGTGIVAAPGSDVLTEYSNYGAAVDIAAPGGDCGPQFPATCDPLHLILSSCIAPWGVLELCWAAGTSMASPHVAGAAALVRALHPDWTPGEVRAHLKVTAESIGGRQGFGAGLLNVDAAAR